MTAVTQGALDGKVALVTGAGRGIGRAVALGFARAGARVCCAARTQADIDDTARAIAADGGEALAATVDVTDAASLERCFETCVARFGGVDVVLVNAGLGNLRKPVADTPLDAWRQVIDVNLNGAFLTARAAIPHLTRRGGGHLILVGSGTGRRATQSASAYACSKAGVWMLTRVLAQELAESDILVNELVPGLVRTQMLGDWAAAAAAGLLPALKTERVKEPEEVVPMAVFLAAMPPTGPTGQAFALNRREI